MPSGLQRIGTESHRDVSAFLLKPLAHQPWPTNLGCELLAVLSAPRPRCLADVIVELIPCFLLLWWTTHGVSDKR